MLGLRGLVLSLLLLPCLHATLRAESCLSASVTAAPALPGSGLWNYCVTIQYDVSALKFAPSHFDLILASITDCPCACSPGAFTFEAPDVEVAAGGGLIELPCDVLYESTLECGGDPDRPEFPEFTLKWDVAKGSGCEPALKGSETFCFASFLPPGAPSTTTAAIKLARLSCFGTVTGTLPTCDCATGVRSDTWGRVKTLYR